MSAWSPDTEGVVVLPDGRQVRGRGLRSPFPVNDEPPEFGLYLTGKPYEAVDWEFQWVQWQDFRLPHNPAAAVAAMLDAYDRAATQRVEVACYGGIGRTGTTIALLARLTGIPAAEAVAWARANYRPDAVETPWQRRFVATAALPRIS